MAGQQQQWTHIVIDNLSDATTNFPRSIHLPSFRFIFCSSSSSSTQSLVFHIFPHTSFNIHNQKSAAIYVNQIMWRVAGRVVETQKVCFFPSVFFSAFAYLLSRLESCFAHLSLDTQQCQWQSWSFFSLVFPGLGYELERVVLRSVVISEDKRD